MTKTDDYRSALRTLADWDSFLLRESGLPGPRGNLELAQAVADEGDEATFRRYLSYDTGKAPANTPGEFLAFCGVVGLGRLLSEGKTELLGTICRCASDPRWRMREGVAMALQRWGDKDMDALLQAMADWSRGNLLEKRAAAAALCEPRLLRKPGHARRVLQILDDITASLRSAQERGVHRLAAGSGLLLECGRRCAAGGRQEVDGEVASERRQGHPLDHAGEPEEESPGAHGRGVGGEVEHA